jgi:hypothetical protein
MADRVPLSKLAHFTHRSELSLRTYLQVGSFDDSHADETAPPIGSVNLVQAIELHVASDLMRMCPSRTDMVQLTKIVMREFRRPRDECPALFAYDPARGRSHIEFSRSVDMGALSYRLTADAHPHPGQGFARDDIGVTSSGFVVIDLREIVRRVCEAGALSAGPERDPKII